MILTFNLNDGSWTTEYPASSLHPNGLMTQTTRDFDLAGNFIGFTERDAAGNVINTYYRDGTRKVTMDEVCANPETSFLCTDSVRPGVLVYDIAVVCENVWMLPPVMFEGTSFY